MTKVVSLYSTDIQQRKQVEFMVTHIEYLHNRIMELQDEQDKLIFELGNLDNNACEVLLRRLSIGE